MVVTHRTKRRVVLHFTYREKVLVPTYLLKNWTSFVVFTETTVRVRISDRPRRKHANLETGVHSTR